MTPVSLLQRASYSLGWVKEFYTQAGIWWGIDPQSDPAAVHPARAATVERLCGPGQKRVLELGAGSGCTAAALADRGHTVVAVVRPAARGLHTGASGHPARRVAGVPRSRLLCRRAGRTV